MVSADSFLNRSLPISERDHNFMMFGINRSSSHFKVFGGIGGVFGACGIDIRDPGSGIVFFKKKNFLYVQYRRFSRRHRKKIIP